MRFATIPENDREKCMKLCGDRWNYSASQREVGENWVNSFFFFDCLSIPFLLGVLLFRSNRMIMSILMYVVRGVFLFFRLFKRLFKR